MELRGYDGSGRRVSKRRPLGDVTNVFSPSSSAVASSKKRRLGPAGEAKPTLRAAPDEISTRFESSSTGSCNSEGRRGVPLTSADQLVVTPAVPDDVHRGNLEPSKVDIPPSSKKWKKKSKAGADVLQSSCPPVERIRSTGDNMGIHNEDVNCHGVRSVPHPKPKKKWRYTMSEAVKKREVRLPRDFVEKQKAYFAEIDAFELPEEVVSDSELE